MKFSWSFFSTLSEFVFQLLPENWFGKNSFRIFSYSALHTALIRFQRNNAILCSINRSHEHRAPSTGPFPSNSNLQRTRGSAACLDMSWIFWCFLFLKNVQQMTGARPGSGAALRSCFKPVFCESFVPVGASPTKRLQCKHLLGCAWWGKKRMKVSLYCTGIKPEIRQVLSWQHSVPLNSTTRKTRGLESVLKSELRIWRHVQPERNSEINLKLRKSSWLCNSIRQKMKWLIITRFLVSLKRGWVSFSVWFLSGSSCHLREFFITIFASGLFNRDRVKY